MQIDQLFEFVYVLIGKKQVTAKEMAEGVVILYFCFLDYYFIEKHPSAGIRLTMGYTAAGLTACRL